MNLKSSHEKLMTFETGGAVLGIDINVVQEINKFREITTTPKTPEYIEGMMNLRGISSQLSIWAQNYQAGLCQQKTKTSSSLSTLMMRLSA